VKKPKEPGDMFKGRLYFQTMFLAGALHAPDPREYLKLFPLVSDRSFGPDSYSVIYRALEVFDLGPDDSGRIKRFALMLEENKLLYICGGLNQLKILENAIPVSCNGAYYAGKIHVTTRR
jgi:hypothetical protein